VGSSNDFVRRGGHVAYVELRARVRYDALVQGVAVALLVLTGCGFRITSGSVADDADPDATSDAVPDGDADLDAMIDAPLDMAPAERVTQDLIALYTFEENAGTVVNDRSGVNPAVNLVVADPTRVQWTPGQLTITQATIIASAAAATKIVSGCRDADALTLEAWIIPRAIDNSTLGRVATLSSSNSSLAVTLMALASHYEFRMDGPMTDQNGLPSLSTADNTHVVDVLRHIVLVSGPAGGRRIYIDGVQVAADQLGGDLASWGTTGHRFAVGNEIDGNRAWIGTYDLVAVYARALTQADVQQNFAAGPQ
jgi:hypothetical protein